jgi:hypothetical protein
VVRTDDLSTYLRSAYGILITHVTLIPQASDLVLLQLFDERLGAARPDPLPVVVAEDRYARPT